jgi:transcriptional regulator with XRE-family HTH domain
MTGQHAACCLDDVSLQAPLEREVIRCKACGLVQYRTRRGNCRRCVRRLAWVDLDQVPPSSESGDLQAGWRHGYKKWLNVAVVKNIGQRIRELRKAWGLTQEELSEFSCISRSYLARIENGYMTPSLSKLEKISEGLGVGLNRLLMPDNNGDVLLEDRFIQGLQPFLRQLDWEQWQSILKWLEAISNQVGFGRSKSRPLTMPQPRQLDDMTRRRTPQVAMGHRLSG